MRTDVLLPQVELTMEQALVGKWLVDVGSYVEAERPLVEIETQKATSEVPSPRAGYVRRLCVREGEAVAAKALLCVLTDTADEPLADESKSAQRPADAPRTHDGKNEDQPTTQSGRVVLAAPAARRVAKELGVDLASVRGTGPAGRITEQDVRTASVSASGASAAGWTRLPAARIALIAQMNSGAAEIPQIELFRQMNVGPLLAKTAGGTFTQRLVVAVAAALRQHPALRTVLKDNKLKVEPVSVAVAIDSPSGLVAPALRAADSLSLEQVAAAVADFRTRAASGTLRRQELVDAPFAITNLGMLGVDFFRPLVFQGQTGVLSVGKSTDAAGDWLSAWMGLAVDHRVVDGAEAARFLQTLQDEILKL